MIRTNHLFMKGKKTYIALVVFAIIKFNLPSIKFSIHLGFLLRIRKVILKSLKLILICSEFC